MIKWIKSLLKPQQIGKMEFTPYSSNNKKFNKLPEDIRKIMFAKHEHAESLSEDNPAQIVYRENDVVDIVNYLLKKLYE